ncbi:hypothetical protein LEN26_004990 [Aphanomyces euteiches]|nr:hypothetical protein AeMF1_008514 [Aphanomyces euteiches]KAH9145208.1 hypothetical protein LEN26_004990 [Aphanomyces euteiches]KAH9168972.1 hypothetical protein AeNC1_017804 [Aphanomyces euteiches]
MRLPINRAIFIAFVMIFGRIYLKDVKASVAKLNDQVETLKGEADAYDAKCNANVGLLLVEQKQRIAEHLQHANEHLDALYVSHI